MNATGLSMPRFGLHALNRARASQPDGRCAGARIKLIKSLEKLTAGADDIADALLQHISPTDARGQQVLDMRFVRSGTHLADCVNALTPDACDALQEYARASGGALCKVIFGADFNPDVALLRQMSRMKIRSVELDFEALPDSAADAALLDSVAESHPTTEQWLAQNERTHPGAFASEDSTLSEIESFGTLQAAGSEIGAEMSERENAALPAPCAMREVQSSAALEETEGESDEDSAPQTSVEALKQYVSSCCEETPASPLQPRDHAIHHELRYQLRDSEIMGSLTETRLMAEFFRTPSGELALDVALQDNPWAAAAVLLGVLESGAPLKVKAAFLMNYPHQVVAGLSKVKDVRGRQLALQTIGSIEKAWAPAAHLLAVTRTGDVMLKHPPSPAHSQKCRGAKLSATGMLEGGAKLLCSATQELDDLVKYDHFFDGAKHIYVIPTGELGVRRKALLDWT